MGAAVRVRIPLASPVTELDRGQASVLSSVGSDHTQTKLCEREMLDINAHGERLKRALGRPRGFRSRPPHGASDDPPNLHEPVSGGDEQRHHRHSVRSVLRLHTKRTTKVVY